MKKPKLKFFSQADFESLHCDLHDMDPEFMRRLDNLRRLCGFAITITGPYGAYRPPAINAKLSPTGFDGPHTIYPGRAADIPLFGEKAMILAHYAYKVGFTGIGQRQHGSRLARFIHLDDLEDIPGKRPRPWPWTYNV